METISSHNPYTGDLIQTYTLFNPSDIDKTIETSYSIQKSWKKEPFSHRAQKLFALATLLRNQKEDLGLLITLEMGKVLRESIAEVEKCALVCEYYAQEAENILQPQQISTNYKRSFVAYNPLGVVLSIMPWNFPFWQAFRAAAPIIMAGNTFILKHASNVSGCALRIEKLFHDAGFNKGVFSTILIKGSNTSKLIDDKRIAAVTLTGSTPAGIAVASAAGRNLKKAVLELGGSDPYIILDDANIELAVQKCVAGRLLNAGQSCIGAKRFIVTEKAYDAFIDRFVAELKNTKTGDPMMKDTTFGPLANMGFRDELHKQVTQSVQNGAQIVIGGTIIDNSKPLYPATVLINVKPGMSAYEDELFGPVASIIKARNETEAIKIANDTIFGLGAAIFTNDIEKGLEIAQNQIEAGCCFVNDFVKSDPRLPFGGIKMSGYGRELSFWGIREFTNLKTIAMP
ncbi:MAG: NAD-dependent succinate-semialdehyde dehydrogenase [Salinivirgaceae bacterium]|nr:NAD-dependent succinate-semialdehyde dehydrogenase [Salinivirgaceae bacterium]